MTPTTALVLSSCLLTLLAALSGCASAADLRSDLREIFSLIPRQRVGFIAARQLIIDPRFRNAAIFIRSPEFPYTWQQIRDTPEFDDIVDYMRRHGASNDVTSILDRIPTRLRSFRIPEKVPVDMMFQRNLSTFLREVVRALPRARISAAVARKVQENGEFAQLYRALRQQDFKELVNRARRSQNLAEPIAALNQNSIDVDDMIKIGFQLLNWGPTT